MQWLLSLLSSNWQREKIGLLFVCWIGLNKTVLFYLDGSVFMYEEPPPYEGIGPVAPYPAGQTSNQPPPYPTNPAGPLPQKRWSKQTLI